MKSVFYRYFSLFCSIFAIILLNFNALNFKNYEVLAAGADSGPKMAIIIDDFGGYERGGVEEMLNIDAKLTCAVIPFVDNTRADAEACVKAGHEVILHMPMESHVNLPKEWYGPVYISNSDSGEVACQKLDTCLENVREAKGVNIHIGSGVSRNQALMTSIISHLRDKNMFFCDSRTILDTKCQQASLASGVGYLGRDVFLEPHGEKSYASACKYLLKGAEIAKEKGYSIAIGHVGREGGADTARAIANTLNNIREMGVSIVPLSEINAQINAAKA